MRAPSGPAENPLVAIVIPHFNRVNLLVETLESIRQQDYENWEVVIVDDGSDEAEWAALSELASEQIKVLRRTDGIKGPSRCRNLGVAAATADYVIFVDSDDVLAPWCLTQRMAKAIEEPELGLWIFQVMLFQQSPGDAPVCWNRLEGHDDLDRFLRSDPPWHTSSPLWRKEVFKAVGGFNERVFYGDDSDLHVRVLLKSISIGKFPESLPDAFVRRGSEERITNAQWRLLEESRMTRLYEGTKLLSELNARRHSIGLWEGQYFAEAEEVLYNIENPEDKIEKILNAWMEQYRPLGFRRFCVKTYFHMGVFFREHLFFMVRTNRRLAKLFLPAAYFPKGGHFHQWRLGKEQAQGLRKKLQIPENTDGQQNTTRHKSFSGKEWIRSQARVTVETPFRVRNVLLKWENRRRLRKELVVPLKNADTPIFFIFTREIVHFAPYCIPDNADGFQPIIVLNAVSVEDEAWMRSLYPELVIIPLKASLRGNPKSLLSHGDVLDHLFAIVKKPFCIQDPDCFVTDPSFWNKVELNPDADLASGPFVKKATHHQHVLPNTYFLMFNPFVFNTICRRYQVSATNRFDLEPAAEEKIRELGYLPGQYPEQSKGYFDTLQAYWLLALAEGYRFKEIPGDGRTVFHIGGTSYLHSSDVDLFHWDYWPLSVIYFNLKLLERPEGERFRQRFSKIIDKFESSENLLAQFPEFRKTWRYDEMQTILQHVAH